VQVIRRIGLSALELPHGERALESVYAIGQVLCEPRFVQLVPVAYGRGVADDPAAAHSARILPHARPSIVRH
jgi:hypothetical protein